MSAAADQTVGEDWQRLYRIAGRAVEHQELLRSDLEWQFAHQIHARLERYEAETFISFKQKRWLHDIDEHLDREGADHDGLTATDEAMREREGMSRWKC